MTASLQRHPVVLYLPESVPALILYGRHVVLVMTNNAWFPSPDPDLATVTADLDALEESEATARGRAKGAAAKRNLAKKKVCDDLARLRGYVQTVVDLSPGEALAITASAGMLQRIVVARFKPDLAAVLGPTPGEVLVSARARRGSAYEWQYSIDGGATWIAMGFTTVANSSVTGLARGTTCLFRFRRTRVKTTGDWSQIISFFVH
jgi:hypothetical protein